MATSTAPITFRCSAELIEAFTALRGDIPQTAAIVNAIEWMVKNNRLISVANPPIANDIDESELSAIKNRLDLLEAAVKADKPKSDRYVEAELESDPEYQKLLDFYGMDIRPLMTLDNSERVDLSRKIYPLDPNLAAQFVKSLHIRISQIETYKAQHQYKDLKVNLEAARNAHLQQNSEEKTA